MKHGVLVRMVCEGVSGSMCNMVIYAAEGKKLEDKVLSLLDIFRLESLHLAKRFCNCVRLAETLIDRRMKVCVTVRANKEHST
jgi:hypothetical protein